MTEQAEILLSQLWAIATAKPTDLMQIENGTLRYKDTDCLTEDQQAAIASIEKSTSGLKIKLYDKLKALELLGKCLGLFERQEDAQGSNLLATILAATGEEVNTYDLPEIQQTADDRYDLVEQGEPE